jgi:hypothetical protein
VFQPKKIKCELTARALRRVTERQHDYVSQTAVAPAVARQLGRKPSPMRHTCHLRNLSRYGICTGAGYLSLFVKSPLRFDRWVVVGDHDSPERSHELELVPKQCVAGQNPGTHMGPRQAGHCNCDRTNARDSTDDEVAADSVDNRTLTANRHNSDNRGSRLASPSTYSIRSRSGITLSCVIPRAA